MNSTNNQVMKAEKYPNPQANRVNMKIQGSKHDFHTKHDKIYQHHYNKNADTKHQNQNQPHYNKDTKNQVQHHHLPQLHRIKQPQEHNEDEKTEKEKQKKEKEETKDEKEGTRVSYYPDPKPDSLSRSKSQKVQTDDQNLNAKTGGL